MFYNDNDTLSPFSLSVRKQFTKEYFSKEEKSYVLYFYII
uniref:Uncharacterized protein n=1 Tax=Anguilla anguilla TaxID=7936 RepID=A0A0E9QUU5_ANGAN